MKITTAGFNFLLVFLLIFSPASLSANEGSAQRSLALASPTLRIDFPKNHSFIQFFYLSKGDDEPNVEIYLTFRLDESMETVHLETLEPEGRAAEVHSVFTMDADGDRDRELFIVASWPVRHTALQTEGRYYRIYVYRQTIIDASGPEFNRAHEIEEIFGAGFDGMREGTPVSFPYKDYHSIRSAIDGA